MMDYRLGRLEEERREVRAEYRAVRELLNEIRLELAKKPSTGALWGMIATVIGVGLTISGISFAVAEWAGRSP